MAGPFDQKQRDLNQFGVHEIQYKCGNIGTGLQGASTKRERGWLCKPFSFILATLRRKPMFAEFDLIFALVLVAFAAVPVAFGFWICSLHDGSEQSGGGLFHPTFDAQKEYEQTNISMYGQSTIPIGMGVDFGDD